MKSPTSVPPVPWGRARLKNVIVVMEWVPDHGALTLEEAPAAASADVTAAQTANLRTTFDTRPLEGGRWQGGGILVMPCGGRCVKTPIQKDRI